MSRQQAIDKHCKLCIFDGSTGSGSWRKQVTDCTSYDCPLFNYRPLDKEAKEAQLTKKRANYSAHDKKIAKERGIRLKNIVKNTSN